MKKVLIVIGIIVAVLVGVGFITLTGNTNTYNNIEEGTNADSIVTLTERQKNILSENGLPTEYNELTYSQKSAIVAIEEMLCAMETKYGISFEYAGYIPGGILEKEQLIAYPSTGDSEDDIFTVTRTLENGEYIYKDGYKNLATKSVFNEFILNYCSEKLGEGNVKVYSLVSNIKTDEFPFSLENVEHNVDGDNWIFIDGAVISKEKYDMFVTALESWLIDNEVSGGNQVILLNGGELKYLAKYNYTDYLSNQYWICSEFLDLR